VKSYLKVIINTFLSSIALSVILGTILKITGPIYQSNQRNNLIENSRRSRQKDIYTNNSALLLSFLNNNDNLKKIDQLTSNWESLIRKYPEIEVSGFFLSLDNKIYAEINSDVKLSAASSIKVPILIVLLTMIDEGEILWNEKLTLTEDIIGGGAGWMAYQTIGQKFPVFEVASEMIRVSDNTATNLLIKRLGGIDSVNQKFKKLGLKNTQLKNYLPDLSGTNLTSTKDLTLAMALVDTGYFLTSRSRDIFREIMKTSKTNTLIPTGILRGLGKKANDVDYHLSLEGYVIYNKTGDIGISYSDTGLIQTPDNSRAFASFIVKGPFNDPRSPELIRNLSAELVPFLVQNQKTSNPN